MLPMPLQAWISEQVVGDEMLWKGAWGGQMRFLRDVLKHLVATGLDYDDAKAMQIARVISTHTSKSICLPVVEYVRPDLGLRLIVRNNFHDWKLSVVSERAIACDFDGLFHTTPPVEPEYTGDHLSSCYFEGFPEDLCFGYYAPSDGRKWSAQIGNDERLYTTLFLLLQSLGAVRPYRWHTRAEHRAELDAQSKKFADKMAAERAGK